MSAKEVMDAAGGLSKLERRVFVALYYGAGPKKWLYDAGALRDYSKAEVCHALNVLVKRRLARRVPPEPGVDYGSTQCYEAVQP